MLPHSWFFLGGGQTPFLLLLFYHFSCSFVKYDTPGCGGQARLGFSQLATSLAFPALLSEGVGWSPLGREGGWSWIIIPKKRGACPLNNFFQKKEWVIVPSLSLSFQRFANYHFFLSPTNYFYLTYWLLMHS